MLLEEKQRWYLTVVSGVDVGFAFQYGISLELGEITWKKGRCLINPVHVAAMVWGFESTGSHKENTQALPVGIPWRTFLPSHCLHCARGNALHCSSFPSCCHAGWTSGLYRHSVQGGVRHFLLDFPLLVHFLSQIKFSPVLCDPQSVRWNWPRLLGRIPGPSDRVWRCNPNKFHGIKLQQGAFSEVTLKWQTLSCDTSFAGLFLGSLFWFFF